MGKRMRFEKQRKSSIMKCKSIALSLSVVCALVSFGCSHDTESTVNGDGGAGGGGGSTVRFVYAGIDSAGLYRSSDLGVTWTETSFGGQGFWSLVSCGSRIFTSDFGLGLRVSADEGLTWSLVDGIPDKYVEGTGVIGSTVLAGHDQGVYRSLDSGVTWTPPQSFTSPGDILSFVASGNNIFGCSGNGIFRSSDRGANWIRSDSGLSGSYFYTLASSGTYLFAGLLINGVFRTSNNGASWEAAKAGIAPSASVSAITADGNLLFAGTSLGMFRSSDNGTSWSQVNFKVVADTTTILSIVANNNLILAGTNDNSVLRSTDKGATWTKVPISIGNSPVVCLLLR